MVALNFNARQVAPQQAMEALPSNWYDVAITESKLKPTKAGTGHYLQLTMKVASGEFSGRNLYARLNIDNPNPVAVEIAQSELSAICWVTNPDAQDSQQMHGIPFKVMAKKAERDDKPGSYSNEITEYANINGASAADVSKGIMTGNLGMNTTGAPAQGSGQGGQPWQNQQPPQQPQQQQQYQQPPQGNYAPPQEQTPQQYQQQPPQGGHPPQGNQPPAQQPQQGGGNDRPPWEQNN